MENYGPTTFGKLNAQDYDRLHDPGTTDAAVSLIHELCVGSKILELAIGTGRVALPLAKKGLHVHGIEASPEMVEKLRAKPGGESIPVTMGDMAQVRAEALTEGPFDLVFLVFNTLFNLTSQDAQVRCFQNAAAHLRGDGIFLVETFVPDVTRFDQGQDVRALDVDAESVRLEVVKHDPVQQLIDHQKVRITNTGVHLVPLPMRYAWPAEIDLMANLAGLRLDCRWGGWQREPFTADSKMHVSVYRNAA